MPRTRGIGVRRTWMTLSIGLLSTVRTALADPPPVLPPPPPPPFSTSHPPPTAQEPPPPQEPGLAPVQPTPARPPPPSSQRRTIPPREPSPPAVRPRAAWRMPDDLENKPRLNGADLEEKPEGNSWAIIPYAAVDSSSGIGLGGRFFLYENGEREDPLFAQTPYLQRFSAHAFVSTRGSQIYAVDYDQPYIGREPWRLRAGLSFARTASAKHFGIGTQSLNEPSLPGRSFARYSDYLDQARLDRGGQTLVRYNEYDLQRFTFRASIERDLFGGVVRPLFGLAISRVAVNDYTGSDADAVNAAGASVRSRVDPTRLRGDCDAGRLTGCGGGWDNTVRIGFAYDTRDYEPDPTSGIFADALAAVSTKPFGSIASYARVSAALRGYFTPLPRTTRLVLAGRAIHAIAFGDLPFFDMSTIDLTEGVTPAFGGAPIIRGYVADRFNGRAMTVGTLELRWTVLDFTQAQERFHIMIAPFIDMGRVYDSNTDFSFKQWKRGQGVALRGAWNLASFFSVELGFSDEATVLTLGVGQAF